MVHSSFWNNQAADGKDANWNSETMYAIGDIVWYSGAFYEALTNNQGSVPPSADWEKLSLSDLTWDSAVTYPVGQIVWYVDAFYLSLQESTNNQPDTSPLYWDKQVSAPGTTWSDEATYSIGSLVWYNGKFWYSLVGDNINNIPTEGANWSESQIQNKSVTLGQLGEAVTAPAFCYFGTDGKLYLGDNREIGKSFTPVCVIDSGVADDLVYFIADGLQDGFTGLVAGTEYFLSNTGTPQTKGSILDGEQTVSLGVAQSTTELYVHVSPPKMPATSAQDGYIGDVRYTAYQNNDLLSKGWMQFAFDNAVSQANYPVLFAKIGHRFNAQHVEAGDADLSGSSTLFYPTPVPGKYGRVAIPDIEFTDADLSDSGGNLRLDGTGLHSSLRYGTAFKFEVLSGTAPTGLVNGTVYYGAFGEDYVLFHPTEADAIATTNRISYIDSGSGTFRLTQEGVSIDHATEDTTSDSHTHSIVSQAISSSLTTSVVSTRVGGAYAASSSGSGTTASAISTDTHSHSPSSGNESNETRGTTFYEFAYIKAEDVTPSGETISALRYSWERGASTTWGDLDLTINHNLGSGLEDLVILADVQQASDYIWQRINIGFYNSNNSTASNVGLVFEEIDENNVRLRTGKDGVVTFNVIDGGANYLQDGDTGNVRITIIKPNLITTTFDTNAMPKERYISTSNVVETLPALTGAPQERTFFWSGGDGTYKHTFNFAEGGTSEYEGEGEGHIKFVSTGAAWKVTEYEDSGVEPDTTNAFKMRWKKTVDGDLEEWAELQDPSPSWSSGVGKYYANYIPTIPKEVYSTDTTVVSATSQDGVISARGAWIIKASVNTTTTLDVWFGAMASGTAILGFSVYIKGRWKA